MTNNKNFNLTIDAVILWVDGNDEKHKRKISPYILDKKKIKSNKFRTRYDQVNEIEFSEIKLITSLFNSEILRLKF